jgi:hypothetical protein
VTGFGRWNGFRHKDVNPQLVDVQCEVCHGPGKAHYDLITSGGDRTEKPFFALEPVTERMCRSCHRDHHDPEFNYQEQIFAVAHDPDEFRAELEEALARMGRVPGSDPEGAHAHSAQE